MVTSMNGAAFAAEATTWRLGRQGRSRRAGSGLPAAGRPWVGDDGASLPDQRLEAVLEAYALIRHGSHGHLDSELATLVHRHEGVAQAQDRVRDLIRDVLADGAAAGVVRTDVAPDELATYCVHGLSAAAGQSSADAVSRLVAVTVAGLRPALTRGGFSRLR